MLAFFQLRVLLTLLLSLIIFAVIKAANAVVVKKSASFRSIWSWTIFSIFTHLLLALGTVKLLLESCAFILLKAKRRFLLLFFFFFSTFSAWRFTARRKTIFIFLTIYFVFFRTWILVIFKCYHFFVGLLRCQLLFLLLLHIAIIIILLIEKLSIICDVCRWWNNLFCEFLFVFLGWCLKVKALFIFKAEWNFSFKESSMTVLSFISFYSIYF